MIIRNMAQYEEINSEPKPESFRQMLILTFSPVFDFTDLDTVSDVNIISGVSGSSYVEATLHDRHSISAQSSQQSDDKVVTWKLVQGRGLISRNEVHTLTCEAEHQEH